MTDPRESNGADGNHELTSVDLLLQQGTAAALATRRQQVSEDPMLAMEMAETVALLEQFRQLTVAPSSRYAANLADVVRRAERRVGKPETSWLAPLVAMLAAALVTFAALMQCDPLHGWRVAKPAAAEWGRLQPGGGPSLGGPSVGVAGAEQELLALAEQDAAEQGAAEPVGGSTPLVPIPVLSTSEAAWQSLVAAMRTRLDMEPTTRLREALQSGLQAPRDALGQWLDPRNALVVQRLDHELRGSAELRRRAMRSQGGLEAVDTRVQEVADQIATDLAGKVLWATNEQLGEVALSVRALIAAGSVSSLRAAVVERAGQWLADRLPECCDVRLVEALAPLVEIAAVRGEFIDLVTKHGARLVNEVLCEQDGWERRRPELLSSRAPAATLADASRLLRLLPGFGLEPGRCALVRQLLLGRLRELRDGGEDGPEVLVATMYGCADLLPETEREQIELQLGRWKPTRLAPDFVTVQQLAWGLEPGRVGFTRLQRELRGLAVLPTPKGLGQRAAFCLSLATNYAAFPAGLRHELPFGE